MRKLVFIIVLALAGPLIAQPAAETPDSLWADLMRGNTRFAAGGKLTTDVGHAPYGSQSPKVSVLSCADSRVPPELVFNQSVSELFVVRVAGNVADTFGVATLEYGIAGANPPWTRLIVVLAHQRCGAVAAALDTSHDEKFSPDLLKLVTRIRESFAGIAPWSPAVLEKAVKANARFSAAHLLAESAIIRKAVAEKRVGLIVAYYSLDTGKVERIPY